MRLRKYRQAEPLTGEYVPSGPGAVLLRIVPPFPFVAQIDARSLPPDQLALVRRAGYRHVALGVDFFGSVYVRPLWLWAVHVICHKAQAGLWGSLRWLWEHHAIGLACESSMRVRLRDIRPWPFGRPHCKVAR